MLQATCSQAQTCLYLILNGCTNLELTHGITDTSSTFSMAAVLNDAHLVQHYVIVHCSKN